MKLALVVPAAGPHVEGGAERAWTGIASAFDALTPHRCDVIAVPSPEGDLAEVASSYARFLDLDVSTADAVLTTKYPAWMVHHPLHDVYLFHRLRGLDDTYPPHLPRRVDGASGDLAELLTILRRLPTRGSARQAVALVERLARERPDDPALAHPGPVGRELLRHLDAVGLAPDPGRRFHAISHTVAMRSRGIPGLAGAPVLPLPSSLAGLRPGTYEHFFTSSRLDAPKRLDLLVRAYRQVPGDIALVIAGEGPELPRLRALAEGDDRVHLIGRVDDRSLADHYRRALAVPFVPWAEDWGLVTVEAMATATPVVTCRDSGGPTELVQHEANGLVVEPDPASLAAALTRFVLDPTLAPRLGEAALARSRSVTWEAVVDALAPDGERRARAPARRKAPPGRSGRPKLVVLSTFKIHPSTHGGQVRCSHLAHGLRQRFDVELVCLGTTADEISTDVIAPGLVQHVVPSSAEHARLGAMWDARAGVHVSDIVAGLCTPLSPEFEDLARHALADADMVMLPGPYLAELAARMAPGLPLAYEAHNCELDLKRAVLPPGPARRELLERVFDLEEQSVQTAAVRSVCSDDDAVRLGDLYQVPPGAFVVAPNGADVAGGRFTDPTTRWQREQRYLERFAEAGGGTHARLCLFIGSHHPPNVDAGRRLLALAPSHPEVLFVLAGGHTEGLVGGPSPANVATVGRVSEGVKQALLSAAGVALNPMAVGSGTNLKLLEYLAAGAPVVTTPFGARGIRIVDGVHAVVAPVDGLGSAIRALDRDEAARVAVGGRALVEERYDWTAIGAVLADAAHAAL